MTDPNGWIKLHRKVLENPVVTKDAEHLAVWIYLLLNATHIEYSAMFQGKKITLLPGQLITGRKSISGELHISESKVTRILKCFENEHQIEQQTSNKNRLVTLKKWEEYQGCEQQNEQQLNNKWTTTEQQLNTNKNIKNIRSKEDIYIKGKNPFQSFHSDDEELQSALKDYVSMRKAMKKPLTERSMKTHIKILESFPEEQWIPIIEESINHNWQSFYPLKNKQQFNQPGYKKPTKAEELDDSYRMMADWAEGGA